MKAITYFLLLLLLWISRILAILFAVLVSFFAFDVFDQGTGFWKTLLALLIHLVPSFLIVLIIILSWKRPWIGGVCFILLGIAYLIWASQSGRGSQTIYIPLFLAGVLFLGSWLFRKGIKEAQDEYQGESS